MPTRRAPGRPQLPLDRIIAAALQIVNEQGADALSLRALAQRLDEEFAFGLDLIIERLAQARQG